MCLIVCLSIVPIGLVSASAYGVSNYCSTAAAEWAIEHWNDYNSVLLGQGYWDNGGDCANFVSQCLYMGGMDMSGYWNTNGYFCHWASPYGNEYAGSFIRCQQLYNFLISKGAQAIKNPSASQVSIGDVILFYKPDKSRYGHSAIVIDIVNGTPVVAAHSTGTVKYRSDWAGYDWHLNFSGSNTTLMKLYGTTCVNNNPRNFDVYTASGSQGLYSSASTSSSKYSNFMSGEYAHIFEVKNTSNGQWGKTFRYGNWGWVKLSGFNYKTHISSCHVDHIFGEWQVVKVANCTQNGQSKRVCKRCGYTETKTTTGGHITDPHATCLTEGYCKICGAKTENPLGHNWDSGKITTQPTCLKEGVRTYTCKRDSSHKYTEVVPALGHDYVPGATAPTCTENGTKTYKCSRCNDSYIAYVNPNNTWSDWMTDSSLASQLPSNKIQTKTQYRYRDKSTKTQATSPGSGWVQNGVDHVDTSYGNWSSWSTTSATGSSTLQVETRVTYRYYYYTCTNCGKRHPVYNTNCSCGKKIPDNFTCTWSTVAYKDSNYTSGTYNGNSKSYTYSLGDGAQWFFSTGNKNDTAVGTKDLDSSAIVIRREYRSRAIIKTNIYNWYKWSSWSNWSDTKYTASSTREVQTRTMYRYDLAALGHDFSVNADKVFIQKDKLLQESQINGNCYSRGKICSRCGAVSPDSTTYKHSFPDWNTERNKYVCIDEANHIYKGTCKNGCGCYILKSDNVHNYTVDHKVQPTCTERGYTVYKCQNHSNETYNDDYVDALGHDCLNSEWETVTYPTCTQSGSRIRKCVRYDACGYYEQEEIPALGHTMVKFDAKHETCLVDGNSEYYYCKNCDKYFSDEDGTHEIEENSWVIPATGHTAGEWVVEHENGCGVAGWECKYCVNEWCDEITECEKHGSHGFLMEEREIPPIPADYYVVKAENAEYNESTGKWEPTSCAEFGIVYYTCRNCENTDHAHSWLPGVVYAPDEVGILDHDWGDYTVKEPSCVHDGEKYRVCKRCGLEEEHEIIPAEYTEHDYVLKETVESPCTAGTNMELWVCSRCGQTDCDECAGKDTPHYYWTGKPADHDVILDVDNSYNATCTEDGKLHYICQNCDYCYDTPIPALGHKLEKAETIEPTCTESGYDVYKCTRKGCDHAEKYLTDEPLGHLKSSPYTVTTKGTCVSDGLEEQFCARVCNGETCGFKLNEAVIPARRHNMGEWHNIWDDDVENQQCRKRDCLNTEETDKYEACTYTETENHVWSEWVYDGPEAKKHTKTCQIDENEKVTVSCTFTSEVTKKATCTEDGLRTYTCTVCGGQYTEVISAREHEWNDADWHVTVEPTIDTEGEEQRECRHSEETEEYEACAATQTRPVDVLGANYRVTIHIMGTDGEYDLISDETIYDYIGKEVEAVYTVNTGMFLNENQSKTSGKVTKDGKLLLEVYIDRSIHNISFDDGTNKTDEDLYYDDVITPPDDPEKEGYTFMGWSEDGETVVDVEPNVPDRDVEYKAVWEIQKYSITYRYGQVNSNNIYKVLNQDYNTSVSVPDDPEFTGYTFAGWDAETPETMPARNMTITALWNVNQYKITFDTDGGSEIDPIIQDYNSDVTAPDDPEKEGYTFDGWDKEIPGKMPAEDMTITAKWNVNQYTITFDTDGGSKIDPITQDYNSDVTAPDNPEKEGYTFAGWSPEIPERMPAEDITVKAIWVVNQYTVTYVVTDEDSTIDTYDYGENIIKPADPIISGKVFTGWDKDIPVTMPAENLVFYAGFVPVTRKATFLVPDDNGKYHDETGNYSVVAEVIFEEGATSIAEPDVPEKEGYRGDWTPYVIGNTDIIIKAVYELKDTENTGEIETSKTVEEKGNGVVTVNLDAFSKAQSIKISENEPLDIVLVVDQSGSMTRRIDSDKDADPNKGELSRRDYLVATAKDFVESVKQNAEKSGAEHRISIVGFGSSTKPNGWPRNRSFTAYENTEVLTVRSGEPVNYNNRKIANAYKNSLMNSVSDYSLIMTAIDRIGASGATAAELGLKMASQVLESNESDRKKIVVFITDGEPTHWDGFDDNVAYDAVNEAKILKNKGALIYSIAISNKADPNGEISENFNRFLHGVSSNYKEASFNNLGAGSKNNGYFVSVNDAAALNKTFENIIVRSVLKTVNFKSVTLYDTITKEFSMTVLQEQLFREKLKNEYGITNTDITVDRRDDGTTYIEIRNLTPKKRFNETNMMIGWGVNVSFDITANEYSVDAGTYYTNTEDAGVIISNTNVGTFIPQSVNLSTDRYIVEYYLDDNVIYDIAMYNEGDVITAPDVDFASWQIGDETVVTEKVAKYYATLGNADKKVTWIIKGNSRTEHYAFGERIVAPEVDIPNFSRWTPDIEPYMGRFDQEYKAEFSDHVHSFVKTIKGKCDEGQTVISTCSCGYTYSESLEPGEHVFEATIYNTESETISHFQCVNCSYNYEKVLTFKSKSSEMGDLYDLNLFEDVGGAEIHEDGEAKYLYVRIPLVSLSEDCRQKIANDDDIYVYHISDDGSQELCRYHIDGDFIVVHCKSFSYYLFTSRLISGEMNINDATCVLNGHKYEQRSDIDNHWDECTVCGDVTNVEPHSDSERDRICDVCGRDMKDAAAITTELDRIYFYFNDSVNLGAESTWGRLIYSSSNEKVAKVDENGRVTGTGRGRCTITVTVEGTDISKEIKVRTDYRWWQWIHWLLFGCIWYFKRLSFWDIIECIPQLLQSLAHEILSLLMRI